MVKWSFSEREFHWGFFSSQKRWIEAFLRRLRVEKAYGEYAAQWGLRGVLETDHISPHFLRWKFSLFGKRDAFSQVGTSGVFASHREYFELDRFDIAPYLIPEQKRIAKEIAQDMLSQLSPSQKEELSSQLSPEPSGNLWLWWDSSSRDPCSHLSLRNEEFSKAWRGTFYEHPKPNDKVWLSNLLRSMPMPRRGSEERENLVLVNVHFLLKFFLYLVQERWVTGLFFEPVIDHVWDSLRRGSLSLIEQFDLKAHVRCGLLAVCLSPLSKPIPPWKAESQELQISIEVGGKELGFRLSSICVTTWSVFLD